MRANRAQSSVEFLFTYSWALGIMLVMIVGFVYFGVNDPTRNIPDICSLTSGFECREFGFLHDRDDRYLFIEFTSRKDNSILILNRSNSQWDNAVSEFMRNRHCMLNTNTSTDFVIATKSGSVFTNQTLTYGLDRNTPVYLLAKLDGECADVLSQIQFSIPYRELRTDLIQQINFNLVVSEDKVLYGSVS